MYYPLYYGDTPLLQPAIVPVSCPPGYRTTRFLRPIPIIVHELEYYDQIASQTVEANPAGLAHEFADWVDSLYN